MVADYLSDKAIAVQKGPGGGFRAIVIAVSDQGPNDAEAGVAQLWKVQPDLRVKLEKLLYERG